MSLTFLAPLALMAAALVAAPILLHLIDQRKVPLLDFPALRFLRQAQKRLRKQSRIRDRWLLLARILGLLLLVLAAAAPLATWEEEIPAGAELSPNVVFLLDKSLSMGYETSPGEPLFDLARERLETVLSSLPDESRVGLIAFDRAPDDLVGGLIPDRRRVARAAQTAELGFGETDLRAAVLAGVRALLATPEGGGDLYLLTDLTDASLPGDQPIELPEQLEGRVRLVIPRLFEGPRWNRSVTGVTVSGGAVDDAPVVITGRVRAEGIPGDEASLSLTIGDADPEGDEAQATGYVDLPGEGVADKAFTLPGDVDHSGLGILKLSPDPLPADNPWYFRVNLRRQLRVLVIDGDSGANLTGGESYFLERALSPATGAQSRITPVVTGPGAAPQQDLSDYAVIFLLNVADPAPLAARLRAFVEAGGGLFIAAGDNVSPERYNRALRDLLPASLGETIAAAPDVTGEAAPTLGYPPVGHPVFRVFREAGAAVFGTTHFYRMIPTSPNLKEGAEVLLKLSTGLPALLGRRAGEGRVMFFSSTLDRGWSDLPLKSIFLPFIQESVHYLAGSSTEGEAEAVFTTLQPVPIRVPVGTGPLTVTRAGEPAGAFEPTGEEDSGAGALSRRIFRGATRPGHYQVFEAVESGGETRSVPRPELGFAVNAPSEEGRLAPLDPERLRQVLPDVPVIIEGQGGESQAMVTVERKRGLAHPLLWGVLALLIIEGLMTLRRQGRQGDEAAEGAPGAGDGAAAA